MPTDNRYLDSRRLLVPLLALMVVLMGSCSGDPEEQPPSPETSMTGTPVDTSATTLPVPPTTEPVTTTAAPVSTTTFPTREVLAYLDDLFAIAVDVGEAVADMRALNNDWDNRSTTGATYPDTVAAMEDVLSRIQELHETIGLIEPPSDRGLPVEHQTARLAVGQMADAALEALAGLRSTDTGERRRTALAEFLAAFERFNGALERIVEIVGMGVGITPPTTTSTATTTTTTAAATTTSTAAVTTTTAPATTTTAAATTTSTAAATTTTAAATPRVDYRVIDEVDRSSAEAVRVWLTVEVDAGATKTELARIGERLAAEYRLSREYQALLVHFVHFPENTSTLGTWIDAPFGDWNRAAEVDRGDYTQHQPTDGTVEKDWTLLPTTDQVTVYRQYVSYRNSLADPDSMSVDQLIALAADELDFTVETIRDAIAAWEAWSGA